MSDVRRFKHDFSKHDQVSIWEDVVLASDYDAAIAKLQAAPPTAPQGVRAVLEIIAAYWQEYPDEPLPPNMLHAESRDTIQALVEAVLAVMGSSFDEQYIDGCRKALLKCNLPTEALNALSVLTHMAAKNLPTAPPIEPPSVRGALVNAVPRMIELTRFYKSKQGSDHTQDFDEAIKQAHAALASCEQPVVEEVREAMDYHNLSSDIPKGIKRVVLIGLPDSINEGASVRVKVYREEAE